MSKKSISIVTLGCSKNEIDSELMASFLQENNYRISDDLNDANIIIVNTCGFIDKAKEESIETIWEMTTYKNLGSCDYLILAGCLAERYSKELLEEIPEIDGIIGTGQINQIGKIIDKIENEKIRPEIIGDINNPYLEDIKRINFNKTEYVRISEGCDNFCTYCIIPKLRGSHRSRKIEDIISEVQYMADRGVEEIILIGQNTSDYGIDLYGDYVLYKLLDELNKIQKLKWIRLLYLYPDNFNDNLIKSIKENEKVLKYVDIPLQHVSDSILKKMNRNTSKENIKSLINKLRNEIPEITIRTTFIVGFPGESERDFKELIDFLEEVKLNKVGVFAYSKEEDTPAYNLPGQIDDSIKEERRERLMEVQRFISENLLYKMQGKVLEVLIEEETDENNYLARSVMDSPEIDGLVFVQASQKLEVGSFIRVKITDSLEYDLIGEAL